MREQKKRQKDIPEENAAQETALRAYQLWRERGCPEGSAEEDWFRAEEQVRHEGPPGEDMVAA